MNYAQACFCLSLNSFINETKNLKKRPWLSWYHVKVKLGFPQISGGIPISFPPEYSAIQHIAIRYSKILENLNVPSKNRRVAE